MKSEHRELEIAFITTSIADETNRSVSILAQLSVMLFMESSDQLVTVAQVDFVVLWEDCAESYTYSPILSLILLPHLFEE